MKNYLHETEIVIEQPIEKVFDFFKKAENLEKLTPDWLNFKILTPLPIEIEEGKIIDYQIKLFGVPFKWKTRISLWKPMQQFRDEQLKGPYKTWIHTHTFIANGNKTLMKDRIEYLPKGWIFSPIIHFLFVKKQVEEIFIYRNRVISSYFNQS